MDAELLAQIAAANPDAYAAFMRRRAEWEAREAEINAIDWSQTAAGRRVAARDAKRRRAEPAEPGEAGF